MKPLAYYFYVKAKISVDFQICISVPLNRLKRPNTILNGNYVSMKSYTRNNNAIQFMLYTILYFYALLQYAILLYIHYFSYLSGQSNTYWNRIEFSDVIYKHCILMYQMKLHNQLNLESSKLDMFYVRIFCIRIFYFLLNLTVFITTIIPKVQTDTNFLKLSQ